MFFPCLPFSHFLNSCTNPPHMQHVTINTDYDIKSEGVFHHEKQ